MRPASEQLADWFSSLANLCAFCGFRVECRRPSRTAAQTVTYSAAWPDASRNLRKSAYATTSVAVLMLG